MKEDEERGESVIACSKCSLLQHANMQFKLVELMHGMRARRCMVLSLNPIPPKFIPYVIEGFRS